jgi:transglutaminase-like putative cysteine protease
VTRRAAAPAPPTGPFAWADRRDAFAARLSREVAWISLLAAALLSLAAGDAFAALPQGLAAAAILLFGRRAEVLQLRTMGRLATIVASIAYAWLLPSNGEASLILARFLCAITASTLLQPKSPREQGLLLATALLQVALAAVLSEHPAAAPAGIAFVALVHRALGTFHGLRAVRRVETRGGVLALAPLPAATARRSDRAGLATLLVAVPLFVVLPRAQVTLFPIDRGEKASIAGISDGVQVGPLGPLADLEEIVGQAAPETPAARDREPYFRVAAYEAFDGRRWSAPARAGQHVSHPVDAQTGHCDLADVDPGDGPARTTFVIDAGASPALPVPEGTVALDFGDPRPDAVGDDPFRVLRPQLKRGVQRWVYTATAPALRRPFLEIERGRKWPSRRAGCLALPAALKQAIAPLVAEHVRGIVDERDRVEALADWIRAECAYSLTGGAGGDQPVLEFLTRVRRGHCDHFAAALAACCRQAGVPSRVVVGWHASRWNSAGFWVLRRRDAHSWVEAYLDGVGWTRFDATPAVAREDDPYHGFLGFFARMKDAFAFEWSRRVVGYDLEAQRKVLAKVEEFFRDMKSAVARADVTTAAAAAILLATAIALVRLRGGGPRGAKRAGSRGSTLAFYDRALALLRRRGLERRDAETARGLALRARGALRADSAEAVDALTAAFERVRYGGGPPADPAAAKRWLDALDGKPVGT